jgi:peptide methionine sulfoxide reductase MsrA
MGGVGDYPDYNTNYTQLNYSETVRLVYDPTKLTFDKIMDQYWTFAGDPTFPEDDPAYMLRIFATTPAQWAALAGAKKTKQAELNATVYLGIYNASDYQFWKARESDQQFDFKNGQTC